MSCVEKHGNCFGCVYMQFVGIEPLSYFVDFFINSICH